MAGEEDETVLTYLIPELCFLTGLYDDLSNNHTAMKKLVQRAEVAPMQHEQVLQRFIESVYSKLRFHLFRNSQIA